MKKKLFCVVLSLLMVLSLLPAAAADAPQAPETATGEASAVRGVHNSVIIDDDPTCEKPRYYLLWKRLQELKKTNINWGVIS